MEDEGRTPEALPSLPQESVLEVYQDRVHIYDQISESIRRCVSHIGILGANTCEHICMTNRDQE